MLDKTLLVLWIQCLGFEFAWLVPVSSFLLEGIPTFVYTWVQVWRHLRIHSKAGKSTDPDPKAQILGSRLRFQQKHVNHMTAGKCYPHSLR